MQPVLSGILGPLLKACRLSADGLDTSDGAVFMLNNIDVVREALVAHAVRTICDLRSLYSLLIRFVFCGLRSAVCDLQCAQTCDPRYGFYYYATNDLISLFRLLLFSAPFNLDKMLVLRCSGVCGGPTVVLVVRTYEVVQVHNFYLFFFFNFDFSTLRNGPRS